MGSKRIRYLINIDSCTCQRIYGSRSISSGTDGIVLKQRLNVPNFQRVKFTPSELSMCQRDLIGQCTVLTQVFESVDLKLTVDYASILPFKHCSIKIMVIRESF